MYIISMLGPIHAWPYNGPLGGYLGQAGPIHHYADMVNN